MYEPIRTKSVHSTVARTPASDFPHRSREEELDIQLAGHLAALLAVTDELRALEPSAELDVAAERLAGQLTRLRGLRPAGRVELRTLLLRPVWMRCISGPTRLPGGRWLLRRPGPIRPRRFCRPSGWTRMR